MLRSWDPDWVTARAKLGSRLKFGINWCGHPPRWRAPAFHASDSGRELLVPETAWASNVSDWYRKDFHTIAPWARGRAAWPVSSQDSGLVIGPTELLGCWYSGPTVNQLALPTRWRNSNAIDDDS